MSEDTDRYTLMRWWQPQDLVNAGRLPGVLRFLAIWFSACVFCILTGLLTPTWSGIAVRLGLLSFDVSFYPPLALCVLLTLWVGPFWGIVPAYITSILIALHRGMPLGTSAVFALATPITLTVLWSSMVMLEVAPSLRRWQDLGRFAVLTLIATGTSSVGAMVWNYHHVLPFSRAHAIWQGWVLGDFLQVVLVVGTLLRIFHHPAQKWLAAQIGVATRVSLSTRFYIAVFILIFVAMAAAGTAAGKLFLASLNSSPGTATISLSLLHTALREAAFFLGIYFSVVLSAIIVFSSTLGSQVERHLRDISERKRVQEEKEKLIAELQAALSKVKLLSGMLPICANCKKIRDDKGYWKRIETYIRDHSEAEFSHSICPQCMERLYPEYAGDADDPGFERTRRMYT